MRDKDTHMRDRSLQRLLDQTQTHCRGLLESYSSQGVSSHCSCICTATKLPGALELVQKGRQLGSLSLQYISQESQQPLMVLQILSVSY